MMYWTLFSLRLIARAGLSFAVFLWLVSQLQTSDLSMRIAGFDFVGWLNASSVNIGWLRPGGGWGLQELFRSSAFSIWHNGVRDVDIRIDHWFLCLTFLILTILTSIRWRKRQPVPATGDQVQGSSDRVR